MRYISKSYSFTITPAQSPPHAREPIIYKIFIRFSQDQNIAGVCKPAQLTYGVCSAVRHIQLRE